MKNKLIIPEKSPFSSTQVARIRDVWTKPPVGVRSLSGDTEYPDLIVNPVYGIGRPNGGDSRGISLKPTSGDNFTIVVVDNASDYQVTNPKISSSEVFVGEDRFLLEPNQNFERAYLSTRVSPNVGKMTYKAILDVDPKYLVDLNRGRIWASDETLKEEEDRKNLRSTLITSLFFGF
ncbi:MAG: hypothetical protein KC506_01080 [Nanoarchaeota archaeon]|nr:hypothetical protein [Nanoarchaeota archaeon]